ncbi:MAG: hypothetical protein A3E87_06720 [Gammaproteobacteria bacterium RIFCSPHIGHO2_12_FULL_35_23]|nr:MAG: hypothetical protein A3E87_06720 [Gammaproteobacteria bacterium RIFCSPHIGHO2_12_FULL_35_23]
MIFLLFNLVLTNCFAIWQIPTVAFKHNSFQHGYVSTHTSTLPAQIISKQQMIKNGAQNVQQALILAGLQVNDLGGDGTNLQISLRGFGDNAGQNTLLLLNGQPLTNPDLGVYDINQIPLAIINHISVLAGSAGVLYGDQAVGGIVNIVTRPLAKQRYAQAGYGSFNSMNLQGGLSNYLKNNLGWRLNLNQFNTDNYRDHNQLRNSHLDLAGNKIFKQGNINVEYQFDHQHLQYPGALTRSQVEESRQASENDTDFNLLNNQTLQTTYEQLITDNWQMNIAGLFSQMNGQGVLTNDYTNSRNEINLTPTVQGAWDYRSLEILPLFGLELNTGQYTFNSLSYDSKANQTIYSGFAQVTIPLFSKFTFISGLRYAYANNALHSFINNIAQQTHANNEAFITDLELSWQISPPMKLYLRRAGSYRFPKTDEDINTNTGKPLKTQAGYSYETGLIYQQARYNGLLSLYQLNLKNEITAIPIPNSSTTFAENQNLPPTTRTGFSLDGNYQLFKPLTLNLIYRYVNAYFSSGPDKGNRIPFVANNNVAVNVIYSFKKNLTFMLGAIYLGNKPFANDPEARSSLLGGYTLYNANVRYQHHKLIVNLQLNNITNKYYYAYAFDMYNGNQTSSYYYPAPGRNFMLNIALEL